MKKISILILSLIILMFTIFQTNTYASSLSLSASASEVTAGDTVTVTVSFGQKLGAVDLTVTYDTSKFSYKSVNKGTANATGSTVKVSYYDVEGTNSISLTFVAITSGSGTFTAKCANTVDVDVNPVTVSGTPSKSVTVKAKETNNTSTTNTSTKNSTSTKNNTSAKTNTTKSTTKTEETVKSNNANLSSLNIEGYSITPEFNKDTTKYYLSVNQDVSNINVNATVEDEKSKIEITGNNDLQLGTNNVTIKVTAEDETSKEYIIEVNKADTSVALSSLIFNMNGEKLSLTPEFDSNTFEYILNTTNASKFDIEALANKEDAYITITGNEELNDGENIIKITVQKDEDSKIYTITVNNTIEKNKTFEGIITFLKNSGAIIVVAICVLMQSAIAIYYAVITYKNSNSSK